MSITNQKFKLNPTQIIIMGFLIIVLAGVLLLMLPISSTSREMTPFIDCLFTSTSAVCVTGLTTVNTAVHWSLFGKMVIIALIQIGGLGFMSILTVFMMIFGKQITLSERILIQESLNLATFKGIVVFVKKIIIATLLVEIIGTIVLSFRFIPKYGFVSGLFKSFFHSISAFCNAGFDVLGASSLCSYYDDPLVSLTIMTLIVFGGLGFSVWIELFECVSDLRKKVVPANLILRRLSLHTKLVLIITAVLIIFGCGFFFIAEYSNANTIGNFSIPEKLLASLFQSVTLRTAGFFTIDQYTLTPSSKLISVVLMAIGGSPGGTAGGMKTTTFGVIIVSIITIIRGNERIFLFNRRISFNTLLRSLVIVMLIIILLLSGCIILSFTEVELSGRFEFLDILYEVTSALSTTGLSVGISPLLTTTGKFVLSALMFIGRLGPFTIALALTRKVDKNNSSMNFPEGKVLVG